MVFFVYLYKQKVKTEQDILILVMGMFFLIKLICYEKTHYLDLSLLNIFGSTTTQLL